MDQELSIIPPFVLQMSNYACLQKSNANQRNRDDIRESIRRDVPDQVDTSGTNASATQVSQVTTGTRTSTMMRGRNSQVNQGSGYSGRG